MNQWSKLAIITGATSLGTWGFHDLSKNVKSLNSGENRGQVTLFSGGQSHFKEQPENLNLMKDDKEDHSKVRKVMENLRKQIVYDSSNLNSHFRYKDEQIIDKWSNAKIIGDRTSKLNINKWTNAGKTVLDERYKNPKTHQKWIKAMEHDHYGQFPIKLAEEVVKN